MGCQACKNLEKTEDQCLKDICKCIQNETLSSLSFFIKTYARNSNKPKELLMNDTIITLNKYKLSFLSYSLVAGSTKSFRFLYEKQGCSLELMNKNFATYNMSPLTIICEKNHSELLKYYLPLFFKYRGQSAAGLETTLDLISNQVKEPKDPTTAMQAAIQSGWITVVDILETYNQSHPDPFIDLHFLNEDSGENAALISIRSGSLPMVKLLFEKYKLDFKKKNRFGETALQICAVCCSKNPNLSFDEIFVYLIEEIQVDPSLNYDEVLLVLEKQELIAYYEQVLSKNGINTSKQEIEGLFSSKRGFSVKHLPKTEKKVETESSEGCSLISSISKASFATPFEDSFSIQKVWLD